jgi:hypothetical protein
MKKGLILIGSPRKKGSTAVLAAEAARGLTGQGIEMETIFLNDLKTRGCQACYWCKKNDVADCAVKDEMQKLHQLMKECDGKISPQHEEQVCKGLEEQAYSPDGNPVVCFLGLPVGKDHEGKKGIDQEYHQKNGSDIRHPHFLTLRPDVPCRTSG